MTVLRPELRAGALPPAKARSAETASVAFGRFADSSKGDGQGSAQVCRYRRALLRALPWLAPQDGGLRWNLGRVTDSLYRPGRDPNRSAPGFGAALGLVGCAILSASRRLSLQPPDLGSGFTTGAAFISKAPRSYHGSARNCPFLPSKLRFVAGLHQETAKGGVLTRPTRLASEGEL